MSVVSPGDMNFLKELLHRIAGIELNANKEYLISARLSEVCKTRKVESITDLLMQLRGGERNLEAEIVEAMTTNETSFFRDATPFQALQSNIIPDIMENKGNNKSLRIWSAACSSGQEPYSVAILLKENFPQLANWNVEIVATDIAENKVLAKARSGTYTQLEVGRGLPARLLIKHFSKRDGLWVISDDLKKVVKFKKVNLAEIPPYMGTFDLILCRNVLIYFDNSTKSKILARLQQHMSSKGYLMIGGSELLIGVDHSLKRTSAGPATCYRKRDN